MKLTLTSEQPIALEREHGGPVRVDEAGSAYDLMSLDAYRSIWGVGTEEEFAESVVALRATLEEVRAGKTRPYQEALAELAPRHGISVEIAARALLDLDESFA